MCIRDSIERPLTYWQTDNSNGLVTVIRNNHWLNSAIRVLISTCSAPLVQTGEHKQFSLFDLDLWPTKMTYNPRLAKVKVDPHAKNQGQRSNGSNRRSPTEKRTDTHTDATKRIIAPATRSIIHVSFTLLTFPVWQLKMQLSPGGSWIAKPVSDLKLKLMVSRKVSETVWNPFRSRKIEYAPSIKRLMQPSSRDCRVN